MTLAPSRYVLLKVAELVTGYSVKAMQHKISEGVWTEGREYRRAPDGHILIDLKGYEAWVEHQSRAVSATSAARSKSISRIRESDTA